MPPTSTQRQTLVQFMSITGAPERTALKVLKATNWKLDAAVDGYYSATRVQVSVRDRMVEALNQQFDALRSPNDEKDIIGIDGTLAYLGQLGINLENAEILVALEAVQAPALGELSRTAFVDAWKVLGLESLPKQKQHIANQIRLLPTDTILFKRVYRHTFYCQKERGQKALPLDNAIMSWELLFHPPGQRWVTSSTDWFKLWLKYIDEKWNKSINKDIWNQTLEFYLRTLQDETLEFWTEDSAWPSAIDDFVLFCKEQMGESPVKMDMD